MTLTSIVPQVIGATNRPDVLDPALLRSGRLDRRYLRVRLSSLQNISRAGKIELPHPTETARGRIMQIHSRKMNVDRADVNFEELARCCDDFNGAQCKAVCVEVCVDRSRCILYNSLGGYACSKTCCSCHTARRFYGGYSCCIGQKERVS